MYIRSPSFPSFLSRSTAIIFFPRVSQPILLVFPPGSLLSLLAPCDTFQIVFLFFEGWSLKLEIFIQPKLCLYQKNWEITSCILFMSVLFIHLKVKPFSFSWHCTSNGWYNFVMSKTLPSPPASFEPYCFLASVIFYISDISLNRVELPFFAVSFSYFLCFLFFTVVCNRYWLTGNCRALGSITPFPPMLTFDIKIP